MTDEQERILANVEEQFVPKVRETFGENLQSITLYGSAITERFTDGVSDINVLIVLDLADPVAVSKLGKEAARIMKKNRITPLLLTDEEFLGSADVFPMEYLDMVDARRVVFGTDFVEQLNITKRHLRHQVETQLRGSIASVRRALIATKGRERPMKRVLRDWFGAQNALFRGLLRLAGIDDLPAHPVDTIGLLGKQYGIDVAGLEQAAKLRMTGKADATDTAHSVLRCLTELAEKIDTLEA